jgi:hypothetical protein
MLRIAWHCQNTGLHIPQATLGKFRLKLMFQCYLGQMDSAWIWATLHQLRVLVLVLH